MAPRAVARHLLIAVLIGCAVTTGGIPPRAAAQPAPLVHPIFARLPEAPQNDIATQKFATALRRFGLGPVEIVDIEPPQEPKAPEFVRQGSDLVRRLQHAPGQTALDEAATEVAATGGAGLDANALSDLYLYRAWAVSRADFNADHAPTPTARAQAFADLVRAVTFTPTRELNKQQYPPIILEDWERAQADVRGRSVATLIVRASPDAIVVCDGGKPVSGPATFAGLAQGDHFVRIEEPGYAPWGGSITVTQSTVTMDVPTRRTLHLDDAVAAAHARRMGAKFALVAEPQPGKGPLTLALALVDVTGVRRNSSIASMAGGETGALDASVMRLDEDARRIERGGHAAAADSAPPSALPPLTGAPVLVSAQPARPRLADDPATWARQHWPLLTAIGVMAATTFAFSLAVAADK